MTALERTEGPGFCRQCQKTFTTWPHVCEVVTSKEQFDVRKALDDAIDWSRAGYPPVAIGRYRDAVYEIQRLQREVSSLTDMLGSAAPETRTDLGPREPNNDMVICPNCTSQFRAIPVNVQQAINLERQRLVSWADRLNKRGKNEAADEVWERVEAIDSAMRPGEKAAEEPKPCEHLRSELLAVKRTAGEPLFQMRKCLDCKLIFRVRSSLKSDCDCPECEYYRSTGLGSCKKCGRDLVHCPKCKTALAFEGDVCGLCNPVAQP